MKQAVIVFILALVAVTLAHAQDESPGGMKRGPHGNPEERLERMREHLGLTDEQAAQIREIQASDLSRREKREQIRGILTDEQINIMREHRPKHGGRGYPPPDTEEMHSPDEE